MSEETALPEVFDPATQEGTSFDLIPIAIYVAQVIEACVVPAQTDKGPSHYIELTWQITEGEYENRFVWQRITFLHSNAQATMIGRKQFKDLCIATGISEQVADVEVFKFIPCEIKVGIEKDKQGCYPDKNKVSRRLAARAGPETEDSGGRADEAGTVRSGGNDRDDGSSETRRQAATATRRPGAKSRSRRRRSPGRWTTRYPYR